MRFSTVFVALALFFGGVLQAGSVRMKNGDRISGVIVRADQEKLTIRTDYMGEVTVALGAVAGIESENRLFVIDQAGQTLLGTVTTSAENLEITTAESGTIRVPRSSIQVIRSEEQQAAHLAEIERLRNPGLLDFWGGHFDTGLSVTRGNADTTNFTTATNIQRKTQRDKISLYLSSIFAQNSTKGNSVVTANAIRGGSRYDIQVNGRMFAFGFADFEFDEFQNLDLRNVLGGGLGWNLVKSERTELDFFGGGSLNQEFFSNDVSRRSAEIVLGEELVHQFSDSTSFAEKLSFYPNLSETGEYRLQFDASLSTQLSDWLSWQVSFSDRYLTNPPLGVQQNDILLSTGLRFAFGRR